MDRISCLPDDVICHILSFLPTKLCMQTSVLSKRWIFLWAHVPFLEFKFHYSCTLNSGILTNILLQHRHDIHTFRLHGSLYYGSAREFKSCIVHIIARNIHNLVLDLVYPFKLPQCLFTCKTLVDFEFICSGDWVIPTSGVYFPALKKLKFNCLRKASHKSIARLLSGCPVLEELSIQGAVKGRFSVSSSILTRLVLKIYSDKKMKFGLKLDTPALRYLQLHFSRPYKFSVGALDSLVEADINLSWDKPNQQNFTYSRYVLVLVGKLYNVRLLTLVTAPIAMVHDSFFASFFASGTKFHNLTKLVISCNLAFISSLLEIALNLRDLELEIHNMGNINDNHNDNQFEWVEPKQVPACLILHLRTIKACYFGFYKEHEFGMERYILTNAKVLKRMEIRAWRKSFEALSTLALLERKRRSHECQLVFS